MECNDKKCPFHGNISLHGRKFKAKVIRYKRIRTAKVEFERLHYLPKFERYEKRRTRLHVHVPACLNVKEGDIVEIKETRPLSKTKHFVITKVIETK